MYNLIFCGYKQDIILSKCKPCSQVPGSTAKASSEPMQVVAVWTTDDNAIPKSNEAATAPFTDDSCWTWEVAGGPGEDDPFAADLKTAIGH